MLLALQKSETAEDYWRVYDEDDPKAEGVFLYDYPHRFHDGGDYAALIKSGDLSHNRHDSPCHSHGKWRNN